MHQHPRTMLVGVLVVVFAFGLRSQSRHSPAPQRAVPSALRVAVILLSFVTMITRRKAMSQVVGFLSMENRAVLRRHERPRTACR